MFRRFLRGKSPHKGKKRLSPTAQSSEGMAQSHPLYQYALKEYSQTVPPGSDVESGPNGTMPVDTPGSEAGSMTPNAVRRNDGNLGVTGNAEGASTPASLREASLAAHNNPAAASGLTPPVQPSVSSPTSDYIFSDVGTMGSPSSAMANTPRHYPRQALPDTVMPDATYEEWYGDAYVGGPIRYIYPSGYQSMRPRGGPWKCSIVVCLFFTWLSIFIIGHCHDESLGDDAVYADRDDDSIVIATQWCGSYLLYVMWVITMSVTGLAAAYCSVIGYIKIRDFAVANSRSQRPGVVGKSDYYVEIRDGSPPPDGGQAVENFQAQPGDYQRTIYQADGTPQFWGGHIYRPTQAAVAVTSR